MKNHTVDLNPYKNNYNSSTIVELKEEYALLFATDLTYWKKITRDKRKFKNRIIINLTCLEIYNRHQPNEKCFKCSDELIIDNSSGIKYINNMFDIYSLTASKDCIKDVGNLRNLRILNIRDNNRKINGIEFLHKLKELFIPSHCKYEYAKNINKLLKKNKNISINYC
jgi:hypothetical protein